MVLVLESQVQRMLAFLLIALLRNNCFAVVNDTSRYVKQVTLFEKSTPILVQFS
jgi:hypothetical protein